MNLSKLAINRPIFFTCIVVVTLLVGGLSLQKLGVDQFPDVTFPIVVVNSTYTGAAPEEVETLISKIIEDSVSTVSGIKRVSSNNLEGLSQVIVEFNLGVDIKFAENEVRDKVANVRSQLPKEIDAPTIDRIDVSDQPVVKLSISGDLTAAKLYDVADLIVKPQLEQVDNVGGVDILGGSKREIKVELDRNKLKKYEISLQSVSDKIGSSAQNVPVGKITGVKNETVFRTIGEYRSIQQIKDTVANFFGGERAVKVGDLGTITDSTEDEKSRSFVDGKPTILLDVHKQSGTNTVAVAEALIRKMPTINKAMANQPGHPQLALVRDGARFIRANVDDVKESIIEGVLLAVAVVFLFLGSFRSTIITGLALPNSLLGSFILMYIMGFTINVMTLLALTLAVGLLIDDAIVVRENIFRRLEEGEDPMEAAENGTKEVTLAVIATTLTVIAVFLPVGFLSGTVGQFFKQFGFTIIFALIISLFDALTMAPMLSAYFAGTNEEPTGFIGKFFGSFSKAVDRAQTALEGGYKRVLEFTLRRPGVIIFIAIAIFIFSLGLAKHIKSTFIPNADNGEFQVTLEMPPGTNLDAMQETTEKVLKVVTSHPEVDRTAVTVGNNDGESNVANIYIHMTPYNTRKILTTQLKGIIRDELNPFAYALPKVSDVNLVGGSDRPFTLVLSGPDLEVLNKISTGLMEKFKKIPGLVEVDTNYRLGKPEFQVQIDPRKAQAYGVLTVQAGQELRGMMDGVEAAKFRDNGEEYKIRVRLQPDQRDLEKFYDQTYVPNINQKLVRVHDIARGVSTQGASKIYRLNRSRAIQITGDLGVGGALGNIRADAEKILAQEKLPPGYSFAFQGNSEDFADLITNMIIAVGLAVTLVFLILSSLYESFVTPFTIMMALPLAIAGALIALFVTGQSMNLFSMIGIIMLLGLVTKNSILLVDYTLQLMKAGTPRSEALMKAGITRLRPILMTTIALIAGMLPVALGLSEASRSRTSMGIAIIGGLISSTILTLVVVPAVFGFIDDFRMFMSRVLGKLFLAKKHDRSATHQKGSASEALDHELHAPALSQE